MPFQFQILTLFPGFFSGPLEESILGRAARRRLVRTSLLNIRDYAEGTHSQTDDNPFGGGAGMVMKPEPVVAAIEAARNGQPEAPIVLLSPQGQPFGHSIAQEWARGAGLTVVCGRYEGFDERIRTYCDREISLGDFVLSGGEPAALAIVDAVTRLLSGVLGNEQSPLNESFTTGALEYPQYTRPQDFRGARVPDVLLSGNHAAIAQWRRMQALRRTRQRRPDLFEQIELTEEDRNFLEEMNGIE